MAYPRQGVELSFQEAVELTHSLFRDPSIPGQWVEQFEKNMCDFLGVRHAITFESQRSGMVAVLKSLEPKEGDEIIVPAYTFFSVPACVLIAGFKPVFADVDPFTWNLDPKAAKSAMTPRTRGIIVSHLNGCPADLDPLIQLQKENNVLLIEDCAQALGATYRSKQVGSFGVGCFSFGDGKNLLTMGGGLIATNDDKLAERVRTFRDVATNPSWTEVLAKVMRLLGLKMLTTPPIFTVTAFPWLLLTSFSNGHVDTDRKHTLRAMPEATLRRQSSFSNAQAALGLAQLQELPRRIQRRIDNARWLSEALCGAEGIVLPPQFTDRTHLYTHYAVHIGRRENFCRALIRRGIDAQRDYCSYCPDLPDFRAKTEVPATPVAKSLQGNVVYLPTQPTLSQSDMLRIAKNVKETLREL